MTSAATFLIATIATAGAAVATMALMGKPNIELEETPLGSKVVIAAASGVIEETLFRGWLMLSLLQGGSGEIGAVVTTAVIFGLRHGKLRNKETWGTMILTALLGLVLGFAALQWGLITSMARHAAWNFLTFDWSRRSQEIFNFNTREAAIR